MATKTFLDEAQLKEAQANLECLRGRIKIENRAWLKSYGRILTDWISEELFKKLKNLPHWEESLPIALGSWARGELCAYSDIDLIFCGPQASVKIVVDEAQSQGLKIRYRVPEDPNDWSVGVEAFDTLAVLHAKAFSVEASKKLAEQQEKVAKRGRKFAKSLLKAMHKERNLRNRRYDSIASYLEPNAKFGPGGLRDLQQALYTFELFSQRFPDVYELVQRLEQIKWYYICIRHWLHLHTGGDLMIASEQTELAMFCGHNSLKDFNKEFHKTLSEVSFYADWMVERAKCKEDSLIQLEDFNIQKINDCFELLTENNSVLSQGKIHNYLNSTRFKSVKPFVAGRMLKTYFKVEMGEEYLNSLFRSGLLQELIEPLKKVSGLVQHDQYHRYTVDAHTLQAVKLLCRGKAKPKSIFGSLSLLMKGLTKFEMQVLLWTCLFHDIAKGSPGDHSTVGARLVNKVFTELGMGKKLKEEVQWMVKNHLEMSAGAFRNNPKSPKTWQSLIQKGVVGRRIVLLSLFTAIDIQATNPDAWTEWKERLLFDLTDNLQSPKATKLVELLNRAKTTKTELPEGFVQNLDSVLVEEVPVREFIEDYRKLKSSKKDLELKIIKVQKNMYWIRLHNIKDEPGLFLKYVSKLYSIGCQIIHCSIETYESYGAYDWFRVKSSKSKEQLRKMLSLATGELKVSSDIVFEHIDLIDQSDKEAIISFRGKERSGFFLAAAQDLFNKGLTIQSAKSNNWGQQFEGVFTVKKENNFKETFRKIQQDQPNV